MENYRIKLHLRDVKILLENLADTSFKEKTDLIIKNFDNSSQQMTFSFSEDEIDKVIDCLTDLLCLKGLDENDEPNAFGYYIEDLIDKFSIE